MFSSGEMARLWGEEFEEKRPSVKCKVNHNCINNEPLPGLRVEKFTAQSLNQATKGMLRQKMAKGFAEFHRYGERMSTGFERRTGFLGRK